MVGDGGQPGLLVVADEVVSAGDPQVTGVGCGACQRFAVGDAGDDVVRAVDNEQRAARDRGEGREIDRGREGFGGLR